MIKKQNLTSNEIIHKFLNGDNSKNTSVLDYHSSWNSIMEVVKKINTFHNNGIYRRDLSYTIRYLLDGGYGYTDYKREWQPLTLKHLHNACYLWILNYNENKN